LSNLDRFLGKPLRRREDARLVTGQGHFADDERIDGCLTLSFFRSPYASGAITGLEATATKAHPGIVAVYTHDDIVGVGNHGVNGVMVDELNAPPYPLLAEHGIKSVGQPVAAIIAASKQAAMDAAELIELEVAESDPALRAGEPGAVLFPEIAHNRALSKHWQGGDVAQLFDGAAHIVSARTTHPRLAPTPMEPRTIVANPDPETGGLTIHMSTQNPFRVRTGIADMLGLEENQVRIIAIDVGGAFGMKASVYPEEVIAAWAALKLQRPVRWVASRSEEMLTAWHARGSDNHGELALDSAGRFLALRAKITVPLGHWLPFSAAIPLWNSGRMLPGPYIISAVDIKANGYITNTAPVGIYRGAGRPEACALMERLVDEAARATGFDPAEIRRINFVAVEDLPFISATGGKPDSGDFAEALGLASDLAGYAALKSEIKTRRENGEVCGIGIASFTEPCGGGWESARVTWNPDGSVTAATGTSSQGHGRETAFAQIVADEMDIAIDTITVTHGDTGTTPEGIGALASRSSGIAGSAMLLAARKVTETLRQTNAPPDKPVVADIKYTADGEAWAHGCAIAAVSIDPDTGELSVERVISVDDAGVVLNEMLFDGQVVGAAAQGLGEVLMEQMIYDDNGQLLTGSFMDYAMPRASDIPPIVMGRTETPSPNNVIGAKGVGEAGTIGVPAAVLNAAMDALRPFGVENLKMPLTSERLWRAMQNKASE
jgi:aerobic carbon-monoxide dehydrogenase large subunit